jgi:UDP-N-acetylglucosamine 1-carboxyvinyltransferase
VQIEHKDGWSRALRDQPPSSDPHRVVTFGGNLLTPGVVESPYIIRVAVALFMVASSITGRSEIRNATPIRRAHPRFVENLLSLGVQVERANDE